MAKQAILNPKNMLLAIHFNNKTGRPNAMGGH
jgi:hypothetical protein